MTSIFILQTCSVYAAKCIIYYIYIRFLSIKNLAFEIESWKGAMVKAERWRIFGFPSSPSRGEENLRLD